MHFSSPKDLCNRFMTHATRKVSYDIKVACYLNALERHPNSNRNKHLSMISQLRRTNIKHAYSSKRVAITGNCPFLYHWLFNNDTTALMVEKGWLPSYLQYSTPFEKTRHLFKELFHGYIEVDKEVKEIKNEYKRKLLNYYSSHSSNTSVNINSFNQYIGIHIRMGHPLSDFPEVFTYLTLSDLPAAVTYINSLDTAYPIFLASDSYAAKVFFFNIFQDRLFFYNATTDYTSDSNVMKNRVVRNMGLKEKLVMVDLLLLSESSYLIGTNFSTFTTMASFLGDADTVYIQKNVSTLCKTCHTIHDY